MAMWDSKPLGASSWTHGNAQASQPPWQTHSVWTCSGVSFSSPAAMNLNQLDKMTTKTTAGLRRSSGTKLSSFVVAVVVCCQAAPDVNGD